MPTTSSTLRERQAAATRQLIVDAALQLTLEQPAEPISHERIAEIIGISVRTTYRHYATRAALMQALWERIRSETNTRFPSTEAEIVEFARAQFLEFNRQEAIVRASLNFSASNELRARGSLEGRPAFKQSLASITCEMPPVEQRRLIALCLAIYSAPFWQLLRDRGELSGDEPGEAAAWALQTLLVAARGANTPGTPDAVSRSTKSTGRNHR